MERPVRGEEEQDPVVLSPKTHRVLLENDRVRVLDIRMGPDEKAPMHSHPDMIIYMIDDASVKFTYPNGLSEELDLKAGQAVWTKAVAHAVENLGDKEVRALNIEFKR